MLTLGTDGTFSYDPNDAFDALDAGEQDSDSFTYEASDGIGVSGTAIVTLTIDGVGPDVFNAPPETTSADSFDFVEGATTAVFTAIAADADAGDVVTFSLSGAEADVFEIDGATGSGHLRYAADLRRGR